MTSTKKSLLASGLSLIVSAALLAGTTFAWFTDSVVNTGNKIEAGTLDVQLLKDGADISESTQPVFNYNRWEPGYSTGADLAVKNNGTLALKYELELQDVTTTKGIENVIDVLIDGVAEGTLANYMNGENLDDGMLAAGATSAVKSIVLKMQEGAGNEYQGATATFDILLKATQAPVEEDGFGDSTYDANADGTPDHPDWGEITTGKVTVPVETEGNTTIKDSYGVTIFTVPKEAIADEATQLTLNIEEKEEVYEGVTPGAGQEATTYDITIEGLKEGNDVPITVSFFIGKGLLNVKIYHYGTLIEDAVYDPETGIVTFESTTFSPYTVVYSLPWDGSVDNDGLEANTDAGKKSVTIDSAAQLAAFAQKVNGGTDYSGYTVTLTGDMDLSGANWTPIGKDGKMFRGIFDGGNHVISGLSAVNNLAYGNGFFGNLAGATVKNITFDGAFVSYYGKASSSVTGNVYGIVSGYAYGNVTFDNVHVINSSIRGYGKVGGILGMAADPGTTVTKLQNCTVENTVITAAYNAGGLVGLALNIVDMTGSDTVNVTGRLVDKASTYVDLNTIATKFESGENLGETVEVVGKYWKYKYGQITYYYAAWGDYYTDYYYTGTATMDWRLLDFGEDYYYLADGLCHNK